jgi:hypothetical protein
MCGIMTSSRQPSGRRRAPRVLVDAEGRLTGRLSHRIRSIDLSLTGCLIRCDTLLDHGAILDLELTIDPQPLCTKVRVAESSIDGAAPAGSGAYLAGLEFLGLAPQEATRLRTFLEGERRRRQGAHPAAD